MTNCYRLKAAAGLDDLPTNPTLTPSLSHPMGEEELVPALEKEDAPRRVTLLRPGTGALRFSAFHAEILWANLI